MQAAAHVSGKAPAAPLFGSIPFGPDAIKHVAWLHQGRDLKLRRENYDPLNDVPTACGVIISKAGEWFSMPFNGPEDFNDPNMQFGKLRGTILGKFGANAMFFAFLRSFVFTGNGSLGRNRIVFPNGRDIARLR